MNLPKPDSSRAFWLACLLICLIGGWLRLQQISIQWLIDDEWHAVHKLIETDGYLPILSSFGRNDYSIPLTLYDTWLANTIGLTELRMRLPMLFAGGVFTLLAMLWARARLGGWIAISFGFLVAVSPLLVNFSRNARPYMITLLLAAVAVWALSRWAREGGRRHAGLYLCCAWLASYLHLIMVPFVLAPLAVVAYRQLRADGPRLALPRSVFLGLVAVGSIAATILPPLLHDRAAMAAKTGADLPNLDTLAGVWHTWLGTGSLGVVLLGLSLAIMGWSRVRAACSLELSMWLVGLLGILAAILVMRPAWVQNPLTFGRYLLPALPLWLLLISAGIGRLAERAASPVRAFTLAAALTGLFLIGTPHVDLLARPNNFTLHTFHQLDYRDTENPARRSLAKFSRPSPFWSRFDHAAPGQYVVAVAGAPDFESYGNPQVVYQPRHRQRLLNLQTSGACGPPMPGEALPSQGVFLRNAVSLAVPGDLQEKRVDWIVMDRQVETYRRLRHRPVAAAHLDECMTYLITRFGPPEYSDATLHAFRIGNRPGDAGEPAAPWRTPKTRP